MKSSRRNFIIAGVVLGVLITLLGAALIGQRPRFSVLYLGLRQTPWPDGPRPLFVITNPLPCRITWTMLAPEFHLASGWTTTQFPKVAVGGRAQAIRFGGETLAAGASFEIYGIAPTNVAYRYPVLWGLHPADALRRPKWKRVADECCERVGFRPLFLPYGIRRTPVIEPKSPNQAGAANRSQPAGSQTNRASAAAGSGR